MAPHPACVILLGCGFAACSALPLKMTALLHFEFMVAVVTSHKKSVTGGLAFLSREQDGSGMIWRGAWPTRVQRNKQSWTDRNAFVTALIVEALTPLARRSCVARMLDTARAFLRTCAV